MRIASLWNALTARSHSAGSWLAATSAVGLPQALRATFPPERLVRLPLLPGQRSLNLSNAVAVAVFEAWRVNGYAGGA